MHPFLKICGITNLRDALLVASYAPKVLGFIFAKESPRSIAEAKAKNIIVEIKKEFAVQCAGVFINPTLQELLLYDFLDIFQLHGEESPAFCEELKNIFPQKEVWKALRPKTKDDLKKIEEYHMCSAILLDAFSEKSRGGTGKTIDRKILSSAKQYCAPHQKLIIAGGVSTENGKEIFTLSKADGLDVSSSLEESVGKKSDKKVHDFFALWGKADSLEEDVPKN